MKTILELMLYGERRDYHAIPMSSDEAHINGYGNTKPGTQWSVSGQVREETEMELAVFGEANPMELYYESQYYLDHPEALLDDSGEYPDQM